MDAAIVNLLRWAAVYVLKQRNLSARTRICAFPFTRNPFPHLTILRHVGRFDGHGDREYASMGRRVYAQAARSTGQNTFQRCPLRGESTSTRATTLLLRRLVVSGSSCG
jgi:hypothetical protein